MCVCVCVCVYIYGLGFTRVKTHPSIDYRIVPGSFPNPAVSVGVCYTAVDAAAGGLITGRWAVVWECSSHPLKLVVL